MLLLKQQQYEYFSNICLNYVCPLQTLDDEPVATGKEYQWQNRPVSEWTNQQVCHWLMGMNMDQYTPEFTAKGIDGQQLLHLDSDKLKVKNILLDNVEQLYNDVTVRKVKQ